MYNIQCRSLSPTTPRLSFAYILLEKWQRFTATCANIYVNILHYTKSVRIIPAHIEVSIWSDQHYASTQHESFSGIDLQASWRTSQSFSIDVGCLLFCSLSRWFDSFFICYFWDMVFREANPWLIVFHHVFVCCWDPISIKAWEPLLKERTNVRRALWKQNIV